MLSSNDYKSARKGPLPGWLGRKNDHSVLPAIRSAASLQRLPSKRDTCTVHLTTCSYRSRKLLSSLRPTCQPHTGTTACIVSAVRVHHPRRTFRRWCYSFAPWYGIYTSYDRKYTSVVYPIQISPLATFLCFSLKTAPIMLESRSTLSSWYTSYNWCTQSENSAYV